MGIVRERCKRQTGFTLLEVIAALVILGILSAIIMNRWQNFTVEVYTGADTLKSHLRYAQALAMNRDANTGDNTITGITYVPGTPNLYWLFRGTNTTGNIQMLPDDSGYMNGTRQINLDLKNIRITAAFTIFFDERGIPYTAYTSATTNTPLSADMTIVVSDPSGRITTNVTVTPLTGFIP